MAEPRNTPTPQEKPSPRQQARGHTVVPFPAERDSILESMHVERKQDKKPEMPVCIKPSVGKKLSKRTAQFMRVRKICATAHEKVGKSFEQARKDAEVSLIETFRFLGTVDMPAKLDLINKFNQQIACGEIRSIKEIDGFLEKARSLAACINLYLQKNEYSEYFTKDISYDIFEQGFCPKSQEDIADKYQSYFS